MRYLPGKTILARWESDPCDLTVANGEAGWGVYAFFEQDKKMDAHYAEEGRRRVRMRLPESAQVVDIREKVHREQIAKIAKNFGCQFRVTLRNMERAYWSITTYIECHLPGVDAYIVPHITPSIRSVQLVIRSRAIEQIE